MTACFERIGLPDSISEEQAVTRIILRASGKAEVVTLCAMIIERSGLQVKELGRKPVLGLFKSVVVTLSYSRRNHQVQPELAEVYGLAADDLLDHRAVHPHPR